MEIGDSHHKSRGWEGQLDRTRRWYEKAKKIGQANRINTDLEDEHDVVYAFFQNCLILRDWLQNSGAASKEELNQFINGNIEMQICRDISNGTKHFKITRPSIDADFSIGREYVPSSYKIDRPGKNETWFIIAGDYKYDIFDLAAKCMSLWDDFVNTSVK